MTPILHVADAEAAVSWYRRLGFVKEWEHRFEEEMPAFVCVARGDAQLYLSEHSGDARPDTLVYLVVPDVEAIEGEFGATRHGAPYGCDFELKDPDGNRLRIAAPRA